MSQTLTAREIAHLADSIPTQIIEISVTCTSCTKQFDKAAIVQPA